jgi:hypothetical protein
MMIKQCLARPPEPPKHILKKNVGKKTAPRNKKLITKSHHKTYMPAHHACPPRSSAGGSHRTAAQNYRVQRDPQCFAEQGVAWDLMVTPSKAMKWRYSYYRM